MKLGKLKRSFFDNLVWAYLLVATLSFAGLALFTNYSTQQLLVNERASSLQSQASMIATQYAKNYFEGHINNVQLSEQLTSLQNLFGKEIWLTDENGQFIAVSSDRRIYAKDELPGEGQLPSTLDKISETIPLRHSFVRTGPFYNLLPQTTISVGIPIMTGSQYTGYIILHSSMEDIVNIKNGILKMLCLAYFVVLLLCLLFIYHLSQKILIPLEQINNVAAEYSNGNFDTTLEVDEKNEIGELATSLNHMADELQKVEQYRMNFISNVSHDFRSPLTSIKGYLEAIQDGTIPPEKQSHYLDVVLNETKRLTKLTSGLLTLKDFNSPTAIILKKRIFDINDMITTTIDSFEGYATKRDIKILPDLPPTPLMVYADKDKISQVVYNLLDNALKFSQPHSSIFITALDLDENKVSISVKDMGDGISEEHQKHIWERFYKADTSRGKDKSGTGLGLAIVKEVIKAHDQTITVESTQGKGTTFTFTLQKSTTKGATAK